MRNAILLVLTCASLMMTAFAAQAQQSPFYVSGSAGAFMRDDYNRPVTFFNNLGQTGPGTAATTYDLGPTGNLAVGYRLPYGFRVEGELGYANYRPSTNTPNGSSVLSSLNGDRMNLVSGGNHNMFTSTINGFYDLPLSGPVIPYIGGGVGFYHESASNAYFMEPNGSLFEGIVPDSSNAMILGEVGVSFNVNDSWSIVPSYRFDHFFVSNADSFNVNVFKLGVRYSF